MGALQTFHRLRIHISDLCISLIYGRSKKAYHHFLNNHEPTELFTPRQLHLLKTHGSVHFFPKSGDYAVTGFSQADEIFRNSDDFRKIGLPDLDRYNMVRRADPEVHSTVIGFIRDAIHKRYLKQEESFLIQTTREIFDRYARSVSFDFYNGFAKEVIFLTSFRLFGFDPHQTKDFGDRYGFDLMSPDFVPAVLSWMDVLLREPVVPEDGRMLNVLRQQMAEGVVNHDQALDIGKLMLLGNLKTSPILLTILFHRLKDEQQKWPQLLSAEPEVLRKFIEECIRLVPVIRKSPREVVGEVSVGECPMKKGRKVFLDILAANRDGEVFDAPDQISLTGNKHRHLSFGVGMHQCPGMQVARHNALVIMQTLLEDFRALEIIGKVQFSDKKILYQPTSLHVRSKG
jgi:cytochrome P450